MSETNRVLYFNPKYLLLTIILFLVELIIALFARDTFIRSFVGDLLVVVLIYCFLRIFLNISYWKIAFGVFLFACLIEILQYFDYVKLLGFEHSQIMATLMGRVFEWTDFLAYFTGFLIILLCKKIFHKQKL